MSEQTKNEEIFKKMIRAGSKTYFINVKISSKGTKYLTICESRKVDGQFQQSRVLIFEDNIPAFFQGLKEAAPSLKA